MLLGSDSSINRVARRAVPMLLWLFLVGAPHSSALGAQDPLDPRELLAQLDGVSIDPARVYAVRDAHITCDRVNLYFNRGFIGLFSEVAGEITGAIFVGSGEILLIPPDPVEKRNLARFIKDAILAEPFNSAYMRFSDETAKELLALSRPPDPEEPDQPTGFVEQWNPVVHRLNVDYSFRILLDLLGERDLPYFCAHLQGVNLGVFQVAVDERLPEAVHLGAAQRARGRLYGDVWCSFPSQRSRERQGELLVGAVRVESYRIDTRIHPDHSLEGRAELELESCSSRDRVLVFELSRRLKVSEVRDGHGRDLIVFQNPSLEESEAAARGNDFVVVVLPEPVPLGTKYRLTFVYQGNVIAEVGNGVLYVGARGSWYPNRGVSTRATYDLAFHYPENLTLVATGNRVEERVADGQKHSRWVSEWPFAVAGFNLGAYDSRLRGSGRPVVEVYAAREAEASLEKRHVATSARGDLVVRQTPAGQEVVGVIPRRVVPLDPGALLDRVADDAENTVRYFETLFGTFPFPCLAISQVPGHFGQGWPGLVYLPTLSFLREDERSRLGYGGESEEMRYRLAVAHEIAHQWWGNQVGWRTYRDQWLSEAFATYAAALQLATEENGERKFRELLRSYKEDLLSKTEDGKTVESGGPIWLGQRLSNSLNPQGYTSITYKKACWVVHMLRGLMTDAATGSDKSFFRMLRDFLTSYRWQNPSTRDFIRHVEKYMTPAMDLEGSQRLDWFFNAWVFGTGIPTYKLEVTTRPAGSKKFVVEGLLEQSGVPAEFEMLVPVIATYGKDRRALLGWVPVEEGGGRFRFTTVTRPLRVAIDEDNLLAVVR